MEPQEIQSLVGISQEVERLERNSLGFLFLLFSNGLWVLSIQSLGTSACKGQIISLPFQFLSYCNIEQRREEKGMDLEANRAGTSMDLKAEHSSVPPLH